MKRESLIFILGVVLIALPFLGIPSAWKRIAYVVLGCAFALVGYQLRRLAYLRTIEHHTEDVVGTHVERIAYATTANISTGAPFAEAEELPEMQMPKSRRARTKAV